MSDRPPYLDAIDEFPDDQRGDAYEGPPLNGKAHEEALAKPVWTDPKPIVSDLLPVAPFDCELLPFKFRAFVADIADRMQCPLDFPGVSMMTVIGSVVGKRIGIRPKRYDDWMVGANLWAAVVGRPGIMKTPAIMQSTKMLKRLEILAEKKYLLQVNDFEVRAIITAHKKKEREKAIKDALNNGMDPFAAAAKCPVDETEKPACRRYIVNDCTVERLGELLNETKLGLTVFRDELMGLLKSLDKVGHESARAFLLESWDGLGSFVYDRIERGRVRIEHNMVSLLGGIQPARLISYLTPALRGGDGDDGLIQRFQLLVYPDVDKDWQNVDRWPNTVARQSAWNELCRLDEMQPASIGAETDDTSDGLPFLRFADDAQELFDAWRAELEPRIRSGDEHPAMESHLAKYRSLVPRLALLCHLADGTAGRVSADATARAIAWVHYLETHARRIYDLVMNPATTGAKLLAKKIQEGDLEDGFASRKVYRHHWAGLDSKEAVEPAFELLKELGWLMEVEAQTGGRPTLCYRINPAILAKRTQGTAG